MEKQSEIKMILLPNQLKELDTIAGFLDEIASLWKLPAQLTMTLNLVLEEAFTNVVQYAYDDKARHDVELTLEKTGDMLRITLVDDGKYYDPTQAPDPDISLSAGERPIGGLGIYLIRKMMDEVEYERKGNKNVLVMRKKL
jgi:serine/threonine-protein kinase RsbW